MLRRQLPVRSPLPPAALLAGLRGLAAPDAARAGLTATLTAFFKSTRTILTDSGTTALALALAPDPARPEAPVALPAYCCYDIATAALAAGVPFVLYDIDPATLGPESASLSRALEAGADRVVIVHLYGVPVNLDAVRALLAASGARLIEDAAQGAGGHYAGVPLGGAGPLSVLSFGRGKGITGGKGGALLVLKDQPLALETLQPGNSGPSAVREWILLFAQWAMGRPWLYGIPSALPFLHLGETLFHPPHPARQISGVAAAVADRNFRGAEQEAKIRRQNGERLRCIASQNSLSTPVVAEGAAAGYLRFPVLLTSNRSPSISDAVRLGINPGYPRTLADLDGFGARRQNVRDEFPGARVLATRLWTLPTHGALTEADLVRLEAWCRRAGAGT